MRHLDTGIDGSSDVEPAPHTSRFIEANGLKLHYHVTLDNPSGFVSTVKAFLSECVPAKRSRSS